MTRNIFKRRSVLTFTSIVFASLLGLQIIVSTALVSVFQSLLDRNPNGVHQILFPRTILQETNEDTKYLQYFVQAGWSNQVVCLKHAYEIALATGRGLILSPVAPHFQFFMKDVMELSTRKFNLAFDLKKAYMRQLRPNLYVPLGNVLDLDKSLPGLVAKVDFREFYQHRADRNGNSLALEASVSHFNTKWIHNQSALEGSETQVRATEHQVRLHYNQTFRDIIQFSGTPPFGGYKIWTLLDSYRVALHQSVYRDGMKPSFRPRFHERILAASSSVQKNQWHGIPYASVHIRGSDGHFKNSKTKAINVVLNFVDLSINEWIENKKHTTNAITTNSTGAIGLFVATDIPNLRKDIAFQKKTSAMTRSLKDSYGINLKLLFSDDQEISNEPYVKALFDHDQPGWVGYPGIFLDQQLAACSPIAFVGTEGSSFSDFINELREDNLWETCNHDIDLP